jgi:hypothetical protein
VLEIPGEGPSPDLRSLSNDELTQKLEAIRREELIRVVGQPPRLGNIKADSYSIRDATFAEINEFQTKMNAPLFMPDEDSDVKQSSSYMKIDLS